LVPLQIFGYHDRKDLLHYVLNKINSLKK